MTEVEWLQLAGGIWILRRLVTQAEFAAFVRTEEYFDHLPVEVVSDRLFDRFVYCYVGLRVVVSPDGRSVLELVELSVACSLARDALC